MAPQPFSSGYEVPDGQGGMQFKNEEGDGSGAVKGTYGYTDAQGLYRVVKYFADQNGYTATVNTNEPGVDGKENPADVTMIVDQPPAGIQEQYTPSAIYGSGLGGVGGVGGWFRGGAGAAGYPGLMGGAGAAGYPGSMGGAGAAGYPGSMGGFPGGAFGAGRGPSMGGIGLGSYGGFGTSAGGYPMGGSGGLAGIYGPFAGIPRSSSGKGAY